MIAHRPIVQAVCTLLESATVWDAGHGSRPGSANGETPFYVVGVAPATRRAEGSWRDDGGLEWVGVQVTAVGLASEQVLLLADKARDVILGRGADLAFTNDIADTGWAVISRKQTAAADDEQDGTHNYHLRFDLLATVETP